jgi:hypothetical protein
MNHLVAGNETYHRLYVKYKYFTYVISWITLKTVKHPAKELPLSGLIGIVPYVDRGTASE